MDYNSEFVFKSVRFWKIIITFWNLIFEAQQSDKKESKIIFTSNSYELIFQMLNNDPNL